MSASVKLTAIGEAQSVSQYRCAISASWRSVLGSGASPWRPSSGSSCHSDCPALRRRRCPGGLGVLPAITYLGPLDFVHIASDPPGGLVDPVHGASPSPRSLP